MWAKMSETKIGLRASDLGPRTSDASWVSGTKPDCSVLGSEVRGLTPAQSYFCQLMLVRIADYRAHARKGGDFFRSTLCIAAGDDDLGPGIFAMNAADRGACVLIGGGGYRAGIKHDDSRVRRFAARSSPRSRNWCSMAAPSAWVARHPKFST